MKFSIIIPVYNVEKYINKCLESILKQTYDNYEVIVVNDGTKDGSQKIIDKYVKLDRRFKSYIKENGGLSDARNYGVRKAKGDYLLFVDSDDYIENKLLEKLNKCLLTYKYDLIKFKINLVDSNYNLLSKESGIDLSKIISLKDALSQEYCETAWSYCYNLNFWNVNKFEYSKGRIHEDFGLTPLVLAKAESIYFLNYYGYNYVKRDGSIVNDTKKLKKRCIDTLFHFDNIYNTLINDNNLVDSDKKILYSFIANGVVNKGTLLNGEDLKWYLSELKKRKISELLLNDTFNRKIKKMFIKNFPNLYIRVLKKR